MKKPLLSTVLAASVLVLASLIAVCSCDGGKMSFKIDNKGLLSMTAGGKTEIAPSTLGMVVIDKTLYAPLSAKVSSNEVTLTFEQGDVVLSKKLRPNGSLRLEVTAIPDGVDTFIFGPYECPESTEIGEMVGACWHADGSLVCIQSLNPKTVGQFEDPRDHSGVGEAPFTNNTGFTSPGVSAAGISNGKYVLTCHADNFTRPRVVDVPGGLKNVLSEAIPAPEGSIVGAAIILTRADNADAMLEDICNIEIEEGLPHPTIDGEWAKTSPHASDIYLNFWGGTMDWQLRTVEKAGANWIYFGNPFKAWGHFDVSPVKYPGGDEELLAAVEEAHAHGAKVGMHTLTNFINTNDQYVTPVPDKDLLSFDPTPIKKDLSINATEIFIGEQLNYAVKQNMSIVRLGDELIQFDRFDPDRMCLTGCKRGAFGTVPAAYPAGTVLTHISDHGYMTLFPNHALQSEMAGYMADFINKFGIQRMSFDGVEGCLYTGHGEFGTNSFVKSVFDAINDHNIISDASTPSHYRWHAHTYFNWGEAWYENDQDPSMYNYRTRNVEFFQRNLMPAMYGWFTVQGRNGIFPPTLPETLEFIISRTVAFKAGICIDWSFPDGDVSDAYLQKIKDWQDFRFSVDVPDEIRERMKDERSDWHLEKDGDKWKLSEMYIKEYDLKYGENTNGTFHSCRFTIDVGPTNKNFPSIIEPGHFRVRVGNPSQKGQLHGFSFCGGWSNTPFLSFDVDANAGDFLEYNGGTVLYHYDADYKLIEKIEGTGTECAFNGGKLSFVKLCYNITNNDLDMKAKYIRTLQTFEF